ADLHVDTSDVKRNMGDSRAALVDAEESVRLYRDAIAGRPSDSALRHSLATGYAAVGMAQSGLGQLPEALENFRQRTAEMEKLAAADPQNIAWRRDLMLAYGHIADLLGHPDMQNLGDRAGALQAYRRAADIGRTLHELDRADQRAATDYGIVLS